MEKIADSIKCDYTCKRDGQTLTARLNFEVSAVFFVHVLQAPHFPADACQHEKCHTLFIRIAEQRNPQ
jgi:hypothetical protein